MSLYRSSRQQRSIVALIVLSIFCGSLFAQSGYQKPPKEILDVLNARGTPQESISPAHDAVIYFQAEPYPPISEIAQPFARVAGVRIDLSTNGAHNSQRFSNLVIKSVADGKEKKVMLPAGFFTSRPSWAPNGKHFYFTHASKTAIELWVGDAQSGTATIITGVKLNTALNQGGPGGGGACAWQPDSKTLLCRTIPATRGAIPKPPATPEGPRIQESFGKAAPVATYEDLLDNESDAKLFDYLATSQLALIDINTGKSTSVGKPAIFAEVESAPDGKHILVSRVVRPYSYIVPVNDFPHEVEVWNHMGTVAYKVASLPLAENTPLGGVPTGARNIHWRPNEPATIVWVEALDEGNPRKKAPQRDKVMWAKDPFKDAASELLRTEQRFAGITWGERTDFAIIRDFDRNTQKNRTWFFDPAKPSDLKLVWELNARDGYKNPGNPVSHELPNGKNAVLMHGDEIFLTGVGASPDGDRPFLDKLNIKTLQTERIFRCDDKTYEAVSGMLSNDGFSFMTRRESPNDPPNYFVHKDGKSVAFTKFTDPAPQLRNIKKQIVKYKRADGLELSFTLYLPPDYKEGERRPGVVWAYPLEFTDNSVAGQVSGSSNRFTNITGYSELFFLLEGYVVLDNTTMPIVGDPEIVNDTYIEQLTADAKAAINKAVEMGVLDPKRVGVGGHSYGAFMTANLLAHTDLFRAGIARSGAYNRTLTPFGFQSERRSLWQAPEMYLKVSPFMYADKIKSPILLIHGEADSNSGTFPIQSDRFYRAIKGNGGPVRYVTLPSEAHGYSARESTEHVLWEMINWFDKWVKKAEPVPGASAVKSSGQ